ncbi:ATP-binding protein [Dyadobacter sp. 3J3]|uniref:ATP-binding protein n=1 Tax=Dyadobacter sp. 3J3 TaxID=2606600 RepID=UPI00286D7314|nr:ATP-binding protein [Dyadobacter sp. 3J3]
MISLEKHEQYIILTFQDNGLGIDTEKYKDQLFGMSKTFHKNNDSRGLGLYITKTQIEAMNGIIELESTVGTGTTFKLYFDQKVIKN